MSKEPLIMSQVDEARARLQLLLTNTLMDTIEDEQAVRTVLDEVDRLAERNRRLKEANDAEHRRLVASKDKQRQRAIRAEQKLRDVVKGDAVIRECNYLGNLFDPAIESVWWFGARSWRPKVPFMERLLFGRGR